MLANPVANLKGQIQPLAVFLEEIYNPQALPDMLKAPIDQPVENPLASVSERSVAQIVPQRDSFGKIFIEPESPGDSSCDL